MTLFLTPESSSNIDDSTRIAATLDSTFAKAGRQADADLLTCASSSCNDQLIRSHPVAPPLAVIVRRIFAPLLRKSTSSSRINSSMCRHPVSTQFCAVSLRVAKASMRCSLRSSLSSRRSISSQPDGKTGATFRRHSLATLFHAHFLPIIYLKGT